MKATAIKAHANRERFDALMEALRLVTRAYEGSELGEASDRVARVRCCLWWQMEEEIEYLLRQPLMRATVKEQK